MGYHRALNGSDLIDGLHALLIAKGMTRGTVDEVDEDAVVGADGIARVPATDRTQGLMNRDRPAEEPLLTALKRAARC